MIDYNAVKLEISSFVMNFNSTGGYFQCVVDSATWLEDLCGIADVHCRKIKSSKASKTNLKHIKSPIV